MGVPRLPRTLVLSLGMHLAVIAAAFRAPAPPATPSSAPSPDVWSGQAFEVDAISEPGTARANTEPAPATRDAPPAAPPASPPSEDTAPPEAAAPATANKAPSARAEPNGAEPKPSAAPKATAEPAPEPKLKPPRVSPEPTSRTPRAEARREAERKAASEASSAGEASSTGEAAERLAAAAASAAPEGGRGAFGMTGLPSGVRHLPYAFTRALPQASSGDEGWAALPLGPVGQVEIAIPVDAEGKLGALTYTEPQRAAEPPAPVRNAIERTLILLRAGTFSLASQKLEHGVQRLRIEFELSEVSSEGDSSVDHYQKGFVPPKGGQPGRSIFVSSSGRRVEARIYVVP